MRGKREPNMALPWKRKKLPQRKKLCEKGQKEKHVQCNVVKDNEKTWTGKKKFANRSGRTTPR